MVKILKKTWLKIRVPKRIYAWGTLGLAFKDDRTVIEKLCDWVDKQLITLEKNAKNKTNPVWHTFFEPCTGKWISSADDIKRIERDTGMVYLRPDEIHSEAEKALKHREKESYRRTLKNMEQKYREIKQGKSLAREVKEGIKKGDYFVNPSAKAFN